jgi:hypothetical protein
MSQASADWQARAQATGIHDQSDPIGVSDRVESMDPPACDSELELSRPGGRIDEWLPASVFTGYPISNAPLSLHTRRRARANHFLASRHAQWLLMIVVGGDALSFRVLHPGTGPRRHLSIAWIVIATRVGSSI